MDNLTRYTEEKYQQVFQDLISKITSGKQPSDQPQAFVLGGQAGSGKSSLHGFIQKEINKNAIVIDNDTFKPLHPNYDAIAKEVGVQVTEHVKPFSNRMTEDLIRTLSQKKYHLVVEGTLRTAETPLKTNQQLKEAGYTSHLYVMATEKELSYFSTLERYEDMLLRDPETARATPKQIHDNIVDNISDNLDDVYRKNAFDDIKVITRENEILYSQQETPTLPPKNSLQTKLDTPLAPERRAQIIKRLATKLDTIEKSQSVNNETLSAIKNVTQPPKPKNSLKDKIARAKQKQSTMRSSGESKSNIKKPSPRI